MSKAIDGATGHPIESKLWTRNLVLIILVNLCVFTNHIMSLSTFPFYIQSLGGTEAMAGVCAAAFSFVAVVIRPFVGWWLDNGVRKIALVAGLVLMGLAPLGYIAVPALSISIALRMLHGVGLSFSNSTTATVASDVICRPRFAEGMGYFGMATALASAIAPALGLTLMGDLASLRSMLLPPPLPVWVSCSLPSSARHGSTCPRRGSTCAPSSTATRYPPR